MFSAETDNAAVYDSVAALIVADVLRGVSGNILAYGQTGSGKTRTMCGVADDPGLVTRAVRASCAAALRRAADSCSGERGPCCTEQRRAPRISACSA